MTDPSTPAGDWAEVRALFDAALPLDAAARERLLADPAIRPQALAEVRSLLAHADDVARTSGRAFLDTPAAATRSLAAAGQRLGAWQLVSPLGAGGMGEVWRAERCDGAYEGAAAIKLLKRGMDSDAVLARFAQERQALARLQHPHIARLLDAGASADGRPYFVMELVEGQPIDRACEGQALERRLEWFLQLGDAVAHAHRNLLVHRDLKPGNVLVDTEGRVKLLDFGIAKALAPEGDDARTTQQGERPFTPQYASPEQVRGEPVSTATDIYSLGVLLYVMLTGQRPYGRAAQTPADAARAVLEEEPTRPSSIAMPAPGWEATRKRLRGDLDNILLKALEKPVERRYPSVEALCADVRAYLGGFPVDARAASPMYVLGKFARRNRWAMVAGTLGGLGLAMGLSAALLTGRAATLIGVAGLSAGLAIALLQARQAALARDAAATARDEARRRLDELKRITADLVFRHGDAVNQMPGGSATQEALLEETVASLEPALAAAPDDIELVAMMASALARIAEIQGNTVTAAPERAPQARLTVARAIALGERAWPLRHADWKFASWHIRARTVDAQTLRAEGRLEDAAQAMQKAIALASQSLALQQEPVGRAFMAASLATQQLTLGQLLDHGNLPSLQRTDDALDALRDAERTFRGLLAQPALLQVLDRDGPPGSPSAACYLRHQIGTVLGARAQIHMRREAWEPARQDAEAAVALRRENVLLEPHIVAWRDGQMVEANTLAMILLKAGDGPGALEAASLARETAIALAKDEGPQSKWAGILPFLAPQWAGALLAVGRTEEALREIEPALERLEAMLAAQPQDEPLARRVSALRDLRRRATA